MTSEEIEAARKLAQLPVALGNRYGKTHMVNMAKAIIDLAAEVARLQAEAKVVHDANDDLVRRHIVNRAQLTEARAELEHIGAFHGDEDCTSQLAAVARGALAKLSGNPDTAKIESSPLTDDEKKILAEIGAG